MSRLTALLLTSLTASLLAAPALADTGEKSEKSSKVEVGEIHVKSARKLIPALGSSTTTRVVSEASSASYTLTRDEDGVTATFGPTTRTTHVETVVRSPQVRVAGVKDLSEPEDVPTMFIVAAALVSALFGVSGLAIGFALGRRPKS